MQISVPPSICARCGKKETVQPTHLFRDKNTNEWRPAVVERPAGWMAWSKDQDLCGTCKETWEDVVKAFLIPPRFPARETSLETEKETTQDPPIPAKIAIVRNPTFQIASNKPSPIIITTTSNPVPLHGTPPRISSIITAAAKPISTPIPSAPINPLSPQKTAPEIVKQDPINKSTIVTQASKPLVFNPPPPKEVIARPSRRLRRRERVAALEIQKPQNISPAGTSVKATVLAVPAKGLPMTIPVQAAMQTFSNNPTPPISVPSKTTTISSIPGAVKPPQPAKYE